MDHSLDQVVKASLRDVPTVAGNQFSNVVVATRGIIGEDFFVVKSPFLAGIDRPLPLMMGLLYKGRKRLSRAGSRACQGKESR